MKHAVNAIVSVDLLSPDIDAHIGFYTGVWGLELAEREAQTAYLRATGTDHHVLGLEVADSVALKAVTYQCTTFATLQAIAERAQVFGCTIVSEPGPSPLKPGGNLLELLEPAGSLVRVQQGALSVAARPSLIDLPTRLSHVNINTTDIENSVAFYREVLGFRFVDRSSMMAFLSCNADHHAVVLFAAPVDGLNHVAFMLPELESVMFASGRMIDHGYPIGWGVGRHGPGNNVFSYFVDPFGYVIEYTADVLQIDDGYVPGTPEDWVWPPGRTDQWGIAPPKSDGVKTAQLAVPFIDHSSR